MEDWFRQLHKSKGTVHFWGEGEQVPLQLRKSGDFDRPTSIKVCNAKAKAEHVANIVEKIGIHLAYKI